MSTVRTLSITTKRDCPPDLWAQYESTLINHPLLAEVRPWLEEVGEEVRRREEEVDREVEEILGEGGWKRGLVGVQVGERDGRVVGREVVRMGWEGEKVGRREVREAFMWLLVRSLNSVQGRERERKKKEGGEDADTTIDGDAPMPEPRPKKEKKEKPKKEKKDKLPKEMEKSPSGGVKRTFEQFSPSKPLTLPFHPRTATDSYSDPSHCPPEPISNLPISTSPTPPKISNPRIPPPIQHPTKKRSTQNLCVGLASHLVIPPSEYEYYTNTCTNTTAVTSRAASPDPTDTEMDDATTTTIEEDEDDEITKVERSWGRCVKEDERGGKKVVVYLGSKFVDVEVDDDGGGSEGKEVGEDTIVVKMQHMVDGIGGMGGDEKAREIAKRFYKAPAF